MLKRSMFGAYINGSIEAVEFYKKAFKTELGFNVQNEDGSYMHAELDIFGQILAISESSSKQPAADAVMQFNLHFGKGSEEIINNAYEVLKDNAHIELPLGEYSFIPSPLMFGLTDKFGVNWCLFMTE